MTLADLYETLRLNPGESDWGWETIRWWSDPSAEGAYHWYAGSDRGKDLPLAQCRSCGWHGENLDTSGVQVQQHGPLCELP